MDQREPDRSYEFVKNDSSMDQPLAFKVGCPIPLSRESPGPSCESMKSDRSMNPPLIFKAGDPVPLRKKNPGPSCESMKSDRSMNPPLIFKAGDPVLLRSMNPPLIFKDGGSSELRESASEAPQTQIQLDAIFTELEEHIMMFVKEQLKRLHRLLASEHKESTSESEEEQSSSSEAVLNITLDFLRRMKLKNLAEHLSIISSVGVCRSKMRTYLQQRLSHGFEGVTQAGNPIPLHQIFTELFITEGGSSEVNQEHEVRHIETASRRPAEFTIKCEDMFKSPSHRQPPIRAKVTEEEPIRTVLTEGQGANKKSILKKVYESVIATYKKAPLPITADLAEAPMKAELIEEEPIRTVLTKGVAGVGKTVLTQKVSLDWAEGRAHQDVQLLLPFTFRELNVLRDTEYSLMELLHHFFSLTKGLCSLQQVQVLFIFDGLDECRLPLDFSRTRVLTEPTESASLEVLLVNLIRGNLLPSAHLWITTRPAAANQIPAEFVSMLTEVRGFADPQKEQYFIKRFRDEQQATAVISHIKSIHSLYIMCHIPVFCWILSTVLLHLMETRERAELPHTLTHMYIYFLVVQAKVKNIKYHEGSGADHHWTAETKKMVQSLGKLAFEQLLKGNLIFYESDLSECGLDAASASVYSGVFTQVFREEPGLYQDKVYCFIHLSVQEFLAALHVHQTFINSGENLLLPQHSSTSPDLDAFYRSAVDQALQSPNGHLDLFLRFLLGLSLPTNQRLLKGLLNETGDSAWSNQETVKYIKKKLNEGLFPERSLNLLHCLNELNDHSLVEEIQENIRKGRLSWLNLPAEWSALSFILLSSDSDLEEFDLRKYCSSERALLGLLPLVKASTKAILSWCNLTESSCGALVSVLSSASLTHLDLSENPLRDSGVELLCDGLKNTSCRLQSLNLSGCLISERGGTSLASALSFTPSHLRELDLSYNHPGASTKLLTALRAPHGPLHSLRLDPAGEQYMVPGVRKHSYEFSMDQNTAQKHLLLSENKRTVTCEWVEHQYPDHEDRFMEFSQVLSSSGLTGCCYWEVQWSGDVNIAVSYRRIRRTGERDECEFGDDDRSWRLRIYGGHYTVCHNKRETPISSSSHLRSGRVGVFLDFEAGTLSFYKIRYNGKLSHLHTFSHSFTEPLFPGFGLWAHGDSVSVVDLRRALPGGKL